MALSVFPAGGNVANKIYNLLNDGNAGIVFVSSTAGDSANIQGRKFTRTSAEPVLFVCYRNESGYCGWHIVGRSPESVEDGKSVSNQITFTAQHSGKTFYIRAVSGYNTTSSVTFVVGGITRTVSGAYWINTGANAGTFPESDGAKKIMEIADLILPK